ncbi:MAG: hypothetical protein WBE44_00410 [Terriglobales bacterium]|jgi:hypothetical protein
MNAVEDFEQVLTLDQAEQFADFDSRPVVDGASSTQQLLDELLGRFEDDGSAMFLTPEDCLDSDE